MLRFSLLQHKYFSLSPIFFYYNPIPHTFSSQFTTFSKYDRFLSKELKS